MQKLLTVISWKYNPSSRHLKIVYSNIAVLFLS